MQHGRRGLAIAVSIAVHAAIGAVFLTLRPHHRKIEPRIAVRVVTPPAAGSRSSGSAQVEPRAPTGTADVKRTSPPPETKKKRGVRSTLPEGPVASSEADDRGAPSTETATIARRESEDGGASGTVRSNESLDLALHAKPPADDHQRLIGGGGSRGGGGGGTGDSTTLEKEAGLEPSGEGAYAHKDTMWDAKINSDGSLEIEDKLIPWPKVGMTEQGVPALAVPIDVTDILLRVNGEDPYSAQKLKFLAQTKELRGSLAVEACKENLSRSLLDIRPRMMAIWSNQKLTVAEKKVRLFALWDECAEEGSTDILKASELIRASILGFIEEHFPPHTELAYTDTDLERLNAARRSRAEFLPYGERPSR